VEVDGDIRQAATGPHGATRVWVEHTHCSLRGHLNGRRPGLSAIRGSLHLDVESGEVLPRALGEVEDIYEGPIREHSDLISDRACEAGPCEDGPRRFPG